MNLRNVDEAFSARRVEAADYWMVEQESKLTGSLSKMSAISKLFGEHGKTQRRESDLGYRFM